MNAVAVTILWMSIQIALFSIVGVLALLLLRRRGPNSAAACCATVLSLTLPLAVMVLCPWPRWSLPDAAKPSVNDRGINGGGASEMVAKATVENRVRPATAISTTTDKSPSTLAIWWQTATDLVGAVDRQPSTDEARHLTWQACLPWLLATGASICLLRLAAGVWAIRRIRGKTQRVDDFELLEAVHEISAQLHSPVVELREMANLRSAATVGWRHPVLLLPSSWRSWTETERRVVLAHELAHVARRDYLTAVIARVATSIHFYQPLVLWLSRQLRIQQELAADSHAAAIAGGRRTYLTTLAQMALRADDQPLPWAARAFLPGTSMLIKRVAWLKQRDHKVEKSLGWKGRWMLAATMTAVALAVAGVRGPSSADSTVALAATDDPKQPAKVPAAGAPASLERTQLRTFDYIPADAKLILAVSPSALLKSPSMQQLQKIADTAQVEKEFDLPLSEIKDLEVIQTAAGNLFESSPRPPFRLVVRSVKPHDWKKWITEKAGAKPKQLGDKSYYESDGVWALIPDDRTLVLLFVRDGNEIKKIISGGETLYSEDPSSFPSLLYSPLAVWADTKSLRTELDKSGVPLDPASVLIRSMLDNTKSATAWANLYKPAPDRAEERLNVGLLLACDSADVAKQSQALLGAARTLLLTFIFTTEQLTKDSIEKLPADQKKLAGLKLELVQEASQILEQVELKSDGDKATAVADFALPPNVVSSLLEPAVIASREAAMRDQTMNNMKQLALAMHNYLAVNNHFPPAAIRDKDGKPLLSWRVAILPYLEQQPLYNEFHLDEPWDSEHNKPLIAKMPAVFRDPHDEASNTNASYFMPTGTGTIGDNQKGTMVTKIFDGTSNTIMLVEAKRDIPWTKPADIEIDPDAAKPLPKFGGHMPEGLFGVALADGSVRGISDGIDPAVLRALFMIASGQPKKLP